MARLAPRKTVPKKRTALEAARFAEFQNPDMMLRGYWMNEKSPITVEVPIFPHGYYPKLGATEHEVRANIEYRRVTVPSVSEIRQHGVDVQQAFFVAEVVVDRRHIKNHNYFRGDFPAAVKALARQHGILFVLPANDMPSARLVRKEVLNFWRQLFTPLFIKGHHYTSGRMTMFMAAPSGSLTRLKTALNLEAKDTPEDNLQEWYPHAGVPPLPRKRRPRGPRPKFTSRENYLADEIASQTTERMRDQLLPVLRSKLEIPSNSHAAQELEDYVSDPATARSLIRETGNGKSPQAIQTWVKHRLIPRIKEIVKEEGVQAAEGVLRSSVQFAFQVTIGVVLSNIFQQMKTSKFGQKRMQNFNYTPEVSTSYPVGGGRFEHAPTKNVNIEEKLVKVVAYASKYTRQYGVHNAKDVLDFHVTPTKVTINFNQEHYESALKHRPKALGSLVDAEELKAFEGNLPLLQAAINDSYRQYNDLFPESDMMDI